MSRSIRNCVLVVVVASCCIAVIIAISLIRTARNARATIVTPSRAVVLRHPNPGARARPATPAAHGGLTNIAPLATVTVSSEESTEHYGEGVADGSVDTNEWVTAGQTHDAWIKLSWEHPAIVSEIELYDRRNPLENILAGMLLLDDGTAIPVPALPTDATPWSTRFAPKAVQWITLRIDSVEGKNAGLAEIMVYGTMNP